MRNDFTDTAKTVISAKSNASSSTNYWIWIAAIELGVIAFLTYRLLKKKQQVFDHAGLDALKKAKTTGVDMGGLMDSINKSKTLYKQLSSKCHPDRFPNDEQKRQLADALFQEITKNQRDYGKLVELKEKAINELNVNF